MVGWVIPHVIDPNSPDAGKQLDKAETYEKHAIKDIPTLTKPASMTDEQFATAKIGKAAEAHSGLGLVYFRRQEYEDAVKELQQATRATRIPMPPISSPSAPASRTQATSWRPRTLILVAARSWEACRMLQAECGQGQTGRAKEIGKGSRT